MNSFSTQKQHAAQLLQWGQLAEAEHAFSDLARIKPDDIGLHCLLADIALRTMRMPLAVEIMEQAIALEPNNVWLRCKMGSALQQAGSATRAAEAFRLALALDCRSREASIGLSTALDELGDGEGARRIRDGLSLELPVIHRVASAPPRSVVLTIDDGPTPDVTPDILRQLRAAGVKASFFVIGLRAEAHPELIDAMLADGHDVLNHGYSHRALVLADVDPIDEIATTEIVLSRHRAAPSPYWLRPPFGAGSWDAGIHRQLKRWMPDTVFVQWTRPFYDWHISDRCFGQAGLKTACADAVRQALAAPPPDGAILLLHDLPFDARQPLARHAGPAMLKELLEALARGGYAVRSLSEAAEGR